MATAQGLRWAVARIPTPGTGLDDQDRYALGGVVLPANSVAAGAFDAFRMSVSGMSTLKPGTQDVAWRASLVNADWPTQGGSGFTATKRYYLGGAIMLPDGALTPNDRRAIGGVYPAGEESEAFSDVFSLSYQLTPTTTAVQITAGVLDVVINSFGVSMNGASAGITGMTEEEWFMHRRQQARARHGRTDRRPRKRY